MMAYKVELEDDAAEDLADGYPVELKISISGSTTIGASLQLAGEGASFRPDFSTLVVASLLTKAGLKATFDEYFLDETYRTDPNDFRPEILLQQWSLDPSDRA